MSIALMQSKQGFIKPTWIHKVKLKNRKLTSLLSSSRLCALLSISSSSFLLSASIRYTRSLTRSKPTLRFEYVLDACNLNTSCCFPLGKQYFPVRKLREADLQITSAMCSSAAWRCLLYRPSLRAVSDLVTAAASAWRLCVCSFFFSH